MNYIEEKEKLIDTKRYAGVDDMITVLAFIAWHNKGDLWGGIEKDEAFFAACRLMQVDPLIAYKIVRKDD